jgi:cyanophycinase
MNGLIALVGSGEYLPAMDAIDRHLLAAARVNGRAATVVCLPTAAGREGAKSVGRWLRMGQEHFGALGATVVPLPIIDRQSADDPNYQAALESADLIYFSGGDPVYLYETMHGSHAWEAAQRAWSRGAVYAGCSAGAMILAKRMPNFRQMRLDGSGGFGIVPADYVLPHFDHAGPFRQAIQLLRRRLPEGQWMLGIDENTAVVGQFGGEWKVMGAGRVHILTRSSEENYTSGDVVPIPGKGGL